MKRRVKKTIRVFSIETEKNESITSSSKEVERKKKHERRRPTLVVVRVLAADARPLQAPGPGHGLRRRPDSASGDTASADQVRRRRRNEKKKVNKR